MRSNTKETSEENLISSKNFKDYEHIISSKEKFKLWIKTLLESMKVFPEIIKTLDKIIELQASTISFMTDIYNSSNTTLSQAEKIIDLEERKNSIINIYLMLQNILNTTQIEEREFLTKKFLNKYSIEELAEEYNISARTVYRRTEKIIDDLCKKCLKNNWSQKFIESQIKGEGWLIEKYKRNLIFYVKSAGLGKLV